MALPDLWAQTKAIDLYENSDMDHDIKVYLRTEFERIRRTSNCGELWPSDECIARLVRRASGQFIYAATVVRYVADPWSRPQDRLATILSTRTPEDHKPLQVLDDLYLTILQNCPNRHLTVEVLGAITVCTLAGNSFHQITSLPRFCETIHRWPSGARRGLHSLINVDGNYRSTFYHATFLEFLGDNARSGVYYVDRSLHHRVLVLRCLTYLVEASSGKSNCNDSTGQ